MAFLGVAFLALGLCQEAAQKLSGNWRSVQTSRGGIGSLLEFREDGGMDYSPGAIVPGRFRLDGKSLILTGDEGDGKQSDLAISIASISVSSLEFVFPNTPLFKLKRVGPPEDPNNLILGNWVTVKPMPDMPASIYGYYRFHGDGTETLSIPFKWIHGRYSVNGEQIRYSLPGQAAIEGALRWEGEALVLPKARGEWKFKRY